MKTKLLVLSGAMLMSMAGMAQNPTWQWAKGVKGINYFGGMASGICADASGNTYVTGNFLSDSIIVGNDTLKNKGLFITKRTNSGTALWSKSPVKGSARGNAICLDAGGNVYVTGSFQTDTLVLGSFVLVNDTLAQMAEDVFVAKYDAAGNVVWATNAGGIANGYGSSVNVDINGNVIITGPFMSPVITFGSFTLNNANTSGGTADLFLVKYDPSGTVLWAKSAGGQAYENASSVYSDAGGNLFITGTFGSTSIAFGSNTLTNTNTNQTGDILVAKFDPSGTNLWVKGFGSTGGPSLQEGGKAIVLDTAGNIFITGEFYGDTLKLGTSYILNSAPCSGTPDVFVLKLNSSGTALWGKVGIGSSGQCAGSFESVSGIDIDLAGNVYIIGQYEGYSIKFGSLTLPNTSPGNGDVFVVKLDGSGNPQWGRHPAGSGNDYGCAISVAPSNEVYVTGFFGNGSTLTFGSTSISNTSFSFNADVYTAKLDPFTGLEEAGAYIEDAMFLYPNPCKGQFTIAGITGAAQMDIFNLQGERILQQRLDPADSKIDISCQAEGVYLVQVQCAEGTVTKKLIVQK